MKKLQIRIQNAAKAGPVTQIVVERDYVQSYVLHGVSRTPLLRDTLVFKGGTALKKVHLGDYRFSEDLDFTALDAPKGAALERELQSAIAEAQKAAQQHGATVLTIERYEEKEPHPTGQEAFKIRAQLPWQKKPAVPVFIEVTHDEPVLLPPIALPVGHGYEEELETTLRCYTLEEIAAEKLRATRQTLAKLEAKGWARSRARDFFDLWNLARLPEGRIAWAKVRDILPQKCTHRNVAIATLADVFDERLLAEVRKGWKASLGPFVPSLPDVEEVLRGTREALERLLKQ
ncbi:MAG TPA: nucleotidyl transferase AbiEii/AbiGii toxin family protein [Planctomycetota bacterium]|nr:nucleotidyl transferase AbiEii/AbiGii toxin family protein [Planctomycetota bacterium]